MFYQIPLRILKRISSWKSRAAGTRGRRADNVPKAPPQWLARFTRVADYFRQATNALIATPHGYSPALESWTLFVAPAD